MDRERKIADELRRAGIGRPMTEGEYLCCRSERDLLMKKGRAAAGIMGERAPCNYGEAAVLLADLEDHLGGRRR